LPATGNFATTVRFTNGSVGQVLYSSQGSVRMGKERFECFTGQMCGSIDDYRTADFYHRDNHEHCSRHRQDKGQAALLDAFLDCLCRGTPPPMRVEDILESSLLTLAAQQGLELRQPVRLDDLRKQIL
jgi:polar amino acid transport system substrate-binding protein